MLIPLLLLRARCSRWPLLQLTARPPLPRRLVRHSFIPPARQAEEDWVHFLGFLLLGLCGWVIFENGAKEWTFVLLTCVLIVVRLLDKQFGR